MKSFSVKNIKSFKNETKVDLKPLTIFVGKNSCGKSSLIRFPVVLAQTCDLNSYSSSPLLLLGKMIDYGTYNDVVFDHNEEDICFSVTLDAQINESTIGNYRRNLGKHNPDIREVEIITHLNMINDHISVTHQKIYVEGSCVFEFSSDMGTKTYRAYKVYDYKNRTFYDVNFEICSEKGLERSFLCCPPYGDDLKESIKSKYFKDCDFDYIGIPNQLSLEEVITEMDMKIVSKIRKEVLTASCSDAFSLGVNFGNFASSIGFAFSGVKPKRTTTEEFNFWAIRDCYMFYFNFLDSLYSLCCLEMSKLSYIGPFRQNPERMYRDSGSMTSKVGVKGEYASNLLIEDYHKNKKLIDSISKWLDKALGYKLVVTKITNGYYQLLLEDRNGIKSNISDVGYGISQILPIVIQTKLRVSKTFFSRKGNGLLTEFTIIEQPELHLHPAAQAELAELFATCVKGNDNRKLLIETHSEHFIRKLQVLIANKESEITSDDVAIYYVDKNDVGEAYVEKMNILPNGQFEKEWPTGFFDKAFELTMELLDNN